MGINERQLIELMNSYGHYLKQTAFHSLHDLQLAEDMVQETFISFYTKGQFMYKASPKTYLYRILMNHIKMYLRKNKIKTISEDCIYESSESVDIEAYTINKMDLSYGLAALDDKYRHVIVLYHLNDLSIDEISKILNCNKSTVKMRLKRGREKLKILLGAGYEKSEY